MTTEHEHENENEELFTGKPTAPDVEKLIAAFGIPEEHDGIMWSEIEHVLKLSRKDTRLQTIVQAWRKRLYQNHNAYLAAIRGIGFTCADPKARVHLSRDNVRFGVRKVGRAQVVVKRTDLTRLDTEDRKAAEHLIMTAATIKGIARTAPKPLEYPTVEVSQPVATAAPRRARALPDLFQEQARA